MRRKTRTKVKRGLIIAGIIIGIILIIIGVILVVKLNKKEEISYDDGLVGKNYFTEITIDLNSKKVKRDNIETTLTEEFDISKEAEDLAFSGTEEMNNLLSNSVFDISINDEKFTIKNKYQTKNIIVEADDIKEKVEGEEIIKLQDGLYILNFYSEKLTKAMYNYYKDKSYVKNIFFDDVIINEPINDISQTMYGETEIELNGYHSLGVSTMGLDNYHKIINDNGNPKEIVIATIGYGVDIKNEFFNDRIDKNYYNFILENKEIEETINQGSRIAEVLADSTTPNVKIMPLVTVTEEGYTSISSIVKAIAYACKKSDVICYELINTQNRAIDLAIENAFKENIPFCAVSTNKDKNYPAEHGMTIATSSIDRDIGLADYSSKGDFIDFTAPSTDVEEIFNLNSTVSRWSGPEYSNAQIVAAIALIKTYDKEATILDVYNFLRNFCTDLGEAGKDNDFGYGCPNFRDLTISNIDKQSPKFTEVTFENETWEALKQVKIKAEDNIRINAWSVTRNEDGPKDDEWKALEQVTPNLDVVSEITENGKYYIYVKDTAGNTVTQEIQIDKVDNTPPQIAYTIDKSKINEGYAIINVTAEDTESGLYDSPFSWDKITWTQENSKKIVKENGRYTVYAVDNLGNTGEQEIIVDCFPQEGTYELLSEGNIIKSIYVSADWTENTNNNVKIELNQDLNIASWQITTSIYAPRNFVEEPTNRATNTTRNNNTNTQNYSLPNNITTNSLTQNTTTANNMTQENTTANNITQNETSTNTNTTNTNTSTTTNNTQQTENQRATNQPITITTSLEANTTYYLWIKDASGNTNYQAFKIAKAQI